MNSFRLGLLLPSALFLSAAARAAGQDTPASGDRSPGERESKESRDALWHIELRRQDTNRGTTEESSRTTLRLEMTPAEILSLLRMDLPLVDRKNGDPIDPAFGDMKVRIAAPWLSSGENRLRFLEETTFPTANPASIGNGKYQLAPGSEFEIGLWKSEEDAHSTAWSGRTNVRLMDVFSVAGMDSRKNIHYTRLEPGIRTDIGKQFLLSLTPKLVFDWEQDGKAGGVLELRGNWKFSPAWRLQLTLGTGLWNDTLPTLYGKKVELALQFSF